MSFIKDLKKKILNKSDMYNFYKDGYKHYKSQYEDLTKNKSIPNHNNQNIINKRLYFKIDSLINYQRKLEYEIQSLKSNNKNSFDDENLLFNVQKEEINKLNDGLVYNDDEFDMLNNLLDSREFNFDKLNNDLVARDVEIKKLNNDLENYKFNFDKLNNDLVARDVEIKKLNNDLINRDVEINKLSDGLINRDVEIKKLNNDLNSKNREITKLNVPFHNFHEYLINSYLSPLVWSPFSEESKRCFAFMEEVAKYLISISDNIEKKPLISVIMPVYNRKDVVMNAIDSVLNQTYENFELIVVDDASTDGTTDLLKTINHEKVRVIFHETNKYASGARNTGLRESKGEYIAYLDSDNLLDERYLAATVGAFLLLPDAGGLYSAQYRYETYDSDPFAVQFAAFNRSLLHNHNFVDMNCFAHRRDVYEKVGGFDETLKGADDWELILKISNNFKIYSVPFLLSKCYVGVVENRVSDLIPTDMDKIRSQNEMLITKPSELKKKLTIIIPIFESVENLNECIDQIISLKLNNLNIIISNNSAIDLTDFVNGLNLDYVNLVQTNTQGFANAVNEGIDVSDIDSDILLLSKNAIVTPGSLESLQKHAYDLQDCGLAVSTQIYPNGSSIRNHVPYAHIDYWCDITPSNYYKNIFNIPLFHNGEFLELNFTPFFCTYIKRDILKEYGNLNWNLGRHFHSLKLLSEYVIHILNLKIYHVSEAYVISNIDDEYRNKYPGNDYDFNFRENVWDDDYILDKEYMWNF